MMNTYGSSDTQPCDLEALEHRTACPPYLIVYWSVLGSSHPPLPEEWWEDPFGGFQQPAASWWQAAQGPPETEQFSPRVWLCRALCGLHPSGFCSQSPQSLLWPLPESRVYWTEDFPEEGTGKNPQTILWSGKVSCWGSENAEVCAEVIRECSSGCIVESPAKLEKSQIEGPSSR